MDSQRFPALLCVAAISLACLQAFPLSFIPVGAGIFIVLGILIPSVVKDEEMMTVNPLTLGAGLLLAFMTVSLFWSLVPYKTLSILPAYSLMPLIVLTAGLRRETIFDAGPVFKGMAVLGALLGCGAFYQFIYNDGLMVHFARYPFSNPNSLAVMLGLGVIAALHWSLATRMGEKTRWPPFALLLVVAAALFTVHSRTAYFALIPALGLLLMMALRGNFYPDSKRNLKIVGCVILPLLCLTVWAMNVYSDNRIMDTDRGFLTSRDGERLHIWRGSLDAALAQNPVIGSGGGTYSSAYAAYRLDGDVSSGLHAHNDVIHLFVELGATGLLILLFMAVGAVMGFAGALRGNENVRHPALAVTAFASLLFMAACAQLTTVFLLVPAMIYAGICLAVLVPFCRSRCFKIPHWHRYILIVLMAGIGLIVLQNTAIRATGLAMRADIDKGDLPSALAKNDLIDRLGLGMHPAVPAFRASALLGMLEAGLVDSAQEEAAFAEVQRYIDEAKRRNPVNPEIYYYQGQLEKSRGNAAAALHNYRRALSLDSRYLSARMALAEAIAATDPAGALDVLKEGIMYSYWMQDPLPYLSYTIMLATVQGEPETAETARRMIRAHLRATGSLHDIP